MEANPLENQITQPQPISPKTRSFWQTNKWPIIIIILVLVIVVFFILYRQHKLHTGIFSQSASQNPGQGSITNNSSVFVTGTPTQKLDCVGNNTCPELMVQGDPYFSGQFSGYADPSMRKDPLSKRIWMSYSWPTVNKNLGAKPIPAVDLHLAYSDDSGKTWQFQGPLWPSYPDSDKGGSGESGYTSNEVSNILPVQTGNTVTWYGIHESYFVPAIGNYNRRPPNSFRLIIYQSSTAAGLAMADGSPLASNQTAAGWAADTQLFSLSPEVQKCSLFTEPSLYSQNGTLYLITQCLTFNGTRINASASDIVVFATNPTGNIHSWKWRYVGTLLKSSQASQLGLSGVEGFTQGDVAKSIDGSLILIVSPDISTTHVGGGNLSHFGCWVFPVSSIDPPVMNTDSSGNLKTLAAITASDLGSAGPGSCTYDPASSTGLLIARRHLNQLPATTSVHQTGIKL